MFTRAIYGSLSLRSTRSCVVILRCTSADFGCACVFVFRFCHHISSTAVRFQRLGLHVHSTYINQTRKRRKRGPNLAIDTSISLSLSSATMFASLRSTSLLLLLLLQLAAARRSTMFHESVASPERIDKMELLQALPKGPVARSGPSTCTHSTARRGARKCPLKLNRVGVSLAAVRRKVTSSPSPL